MWGCFFGNDVAKLDFLVPNLLNLLECLEILCTRCCKFSHANFLWMIHVLLVFICHYIWIGISFWSYAKFPWGCNLSTWNFEYPRASRRNRIVHRWRTCRTWEVDAASNEFGSTLILLSDFPEAIGIPGLLDAIGLDAVEELVARNEDRFVAVGRDLDTTLSSTFWSCILFAIVEQLVKLKFLVHQVELNWLILDYWRRLFHSSRVKFPSVNMSASWCVESV